MSEKDDSDRTLTGVVLPALSLERTTAYLVVVASSDSTGRMFRLERDNIVLGRAPDADFRIDDVGISRYHARVHVRGKNVEIVDLGSKNGVFFNGERVERITLEDGDKFQVGTATVLKVSYQDQLDEQLQQNLYDSATRDALTRVYNKKFFMEVVAKDFSYCQRHSVPLTLVMLDLDHFKQVNDTYGHPAGDLVLSKVAEVLRAAIRNEDVLARVGGEEFAILLRECEEDQAVRFAERIRRQVERIRLDYSGQELKVTVSAGVASLRSKERDHGNVEDLIAAADRNLYRAKESGRNRVYASDSAEVPW